MIGDKDSKDIALGYEIRKYDQLTPQEKAIIPEGYKDSPQAYKTAVDAFAEAAKKAVKTLKDGERDRKTNLEKQKDALAGSADFHQYLMGTKGSGYEKTGYVPQLRTIGVTGKMVMDNAALASAKAALEAALAKPSNMAYVVKKDALEITVAKREGWKTGTPVSLFKVFTDSTKAYDLVDSTTARPVYKKKGKTDFVTEETQYVQDDDGIFTRRYAVMHKGKDVMQALLTDGNVVKGKLQHELGVTNRHKLDSKSPLYKASALDKDDEIYKMQAVEGAVTNKPTGSPLNLREMLHVHQEKGSGPSGRGLCLTSVSFSKNQVDSGAWKDPGVLKTMYCNQGTKFEDPGKTVLVVVDLATVEQKHELLYNLYRPESQAAAVNVPIAKKAPAKGFFDNNQHMLDSVSKNREIFLRVLERKNIVNWADVEAAIKPAVVAAKTT